MTIIVFKNLTAMVTLLQNGDLKDTGDGQFNGPNGVATDSSGNVYVADTDNNRIQKFDSNGNFITKWGFDGDGDGQFKFQKVLLQILQVMCM